MSKFKRGDRITCHGIEGYYVGNKDGQDIMERIDEKGWRKADNARFIPDDYIPIIGDSYWSIILEYCKLVKAAEFNYEIY